MSTDPRPVGQPLPLSSATKPAEAKKAGRPSGKTNSDTLSARDRFALNMVKQAKRGCDIIQGRIRDGLSVSSAVLQAASTLSATAVESMSESDE